MSRYEHDIVPDAKLLMRFDSANWLAGKSIPYPPHVFMLKQKTFHSHVPMFHGYLVGGFKYYCVIDLRIFSGWANLPPSRHGVFPSCLWPLSVQDKVGEVPFSSGTPSTDDVTSEGAASCAAPCRRCTMVNLRVGHQQVD